MIGCDCDGLAGVIGCYCGGLAGMIGCISCIAGGIAEVIFCNGGGLAGVVVPVSSQYIGHLFYTPVRQEVERGVVSLGERATYLKNAHDGECHFHCLPCPL